MRQFVALGAPRCEAAGLGAVVCERLAVDYEHIRFLSNRLVIEQVSAERLTQFEFNPRWARVEHGASLRDPIKLVSRGQAVVVGLHPAHHRRAQFANELRATLRRCG